ncbi:MAG TPA: capsule assembly Wzi family protein, partial [Longimicrobium sp.]|nr:capsule assembly Wzi family protein [Longimicrobium sp.]
MISTFRPAALLAAVLCSVPLAAQLPDSAAAPRATRALLTVGGADDELWRLEQVVRGASDAGYLLRSTSSATPRGASGISVLVPELESAWNSRIPFSLNDGAMWAGRGASGRAMAGIAITAGPVRLIVAPEVTWSQNTAFDSLLPVTWTAEERADYIPPWEWGIHSIDLPWRHGDGEVRTVHPGQSSLTVYAGPIALGAATESQWWGPGIRSGILFSNNAPGFPHLFLRTARPLRTPLGRLEGKWLLGELSSSGFRTPEDDADGRRALSALGLTLQPGAGFTLGIARAVYSPAEELGDVMGAAADAVGQWNAGRDSTGRAAEQMTALSARWLSPGDGAELYVEWARRELPASFREVLEQPEHSQGYTLGGQLARPTGAGALRFQAEHTTLEKSPTFRDRPIGSWYASRRIPEGYTHRGQVVGAGIGPGASGQWLAMDYVARTGQLGTFLGRVRWANDAYYDKPGGPNRYRAHDVSIFAGARGGFDLGGARLGVEYTLMRRWNYLFQNYSQDWETRDRSVNPVNHQVRLQLSAAPRL